jgi:hypothetical protein
MQKHIILWNLANGLFVAIALFLILPVKVGAQTVERIGVPLFDVPNLIQKSDALHGLIAVSGILRCSSLSTCWFEHPTDSKQHVEVDLSQISRQERQQIGECVAAPCGDLLVGLVDRAERGIRFRMLR